MSREALKRAMWATLENPYMTVNLCANYDTYTIKNGYMSYYKRRIHTLETGSIQYEIGFEHDGEFYKTLQPTSESYVFTHGMTHDLLHGMMREGQIQKTPALNPSPDVILDNVELYVDGVDYRHALEYYTRYEEMFATERPTLVAEFRDQDPRRHYKWVNGQYHAHDRNDTELTLRGRPDFDNEAELFQLGLVIDVDFESYKRTIVLMDLMLTIADPMLLDKNPKTVKAHRY